MKSKANEKRLKESLKQANKEKREYDINAVILFIVYAIVCYMVVKELLERLN